MGNVLKAHRELLNLMCEFDQYLRNEFCVKRRKLGFQHCSFRANVIWFFANNLTNHARSFTFYGASQLNLSQSHPNMLKEFPKSGFSVRRVPGKFNRPSSDQVFEQTVNRDLK